MDSVPPDLELAASLSAADAQHDGKLEGAQLRGLYLDEIRQTIEDLVEAGIGRCLDELESRLSQRRGNEGKGMADGALMTKRELAEFLNVHPRTVTRLLADGHIPVIRLGRSTLRFRLSDVLDAIGKED